MDILIEEHQQLLIMMIKHDVDYMLIGGYAVIYYGYERTTGDMDIWIKPDAENITKLINALDEYGIAAESLEQISQLDLLTAQVFFIGDQPKKIDFLTRVNGVNYDEAKVAANSFYMEGKQIHVINYHHLVLTKFNTGRTKDQADIEELQRINKYRKRGL